MQSQVPLPSDMATPTSQGWEVRPAPGGSPQEQLVRGGSVMGGAVGHPASVISHGGGLKRFLISFKQARSGVGRSRMSRRDCMLE